MAGAVVVVVADAEGAAVIESTASPAPTHRPRGLLLQWHITHRCNLRCAHCYQDRYDGTGELSLDQLLDVLRDYEGMLAEWRADAGSPRAVRGHITLTGGEPFARRDFMPLLERIAGARDRYSFALLTNGSFIDVAMARRLRRLRPRFVQVSMEGTEATHDRIRGPGDFRRTVAAIRHLVRFGIPTLISFTAHRLNFREFPAVAGLGIRLGVNRVWSDRLIPAVHRTGVDAPEILSPEETQEFFEIMAEARRRAQRRWFCRTEIAMHRALQFLVDGDDAYHCTAGDSLITVMPDGDVYPCRRMPIPVGNVLRSSLRDIYHTNTLLRQLRDRSQTSDGCTGCDHLARCRGGLKCLSYAVTGNPFARDPGCWLPERDARAALSSSGSRTCSDDGLG